MQLLGSSLLAVAALAGGAAAAAGPFPDLTCTAGDAWLTVDYPIAYYKGAVQCGNLFVKADIATRPLVHYYKARADRFYTLLYFSTESGGTVSWPDEPTEGTAHTHWVVGNLTAATLMGSGDTSEGDELWGDDWPHHGPSPSQPYPFYLMEHEGPTPAPNSSGVVPDCFPSVTQYCTHAEVDAWLASYEWEVVANNYLVGLFYNDTFRDPAV